MRRPFLVTALMLAWPAASAEPEPKLSAVPPEPELLEYLGESLGVDTELALFMESREAKRAIKDAAKEDPKEDDHE